MVLSTPFHDKTIALSDHEDQSDGEAAQHLADILASLRHIAINVSTPLRIRVACGEGATDDLFPSLRVAFQRLGVRNLDLTIGDTSDLSSFESLLSERITRAVGNTLSLSRAKYLAASLDEADLSQPALLGDGASVPVSSQLTLSARCFGPRNSPPVVLVLPCGMPLELCMPWIEVLSRRYLVVTWETRGLFGACYAFDELDVDAVAQVDDMVVIMNYFGIEDAHVFGVCGGAVIGLMAAARHPSRVRSLSAWYGDYNLGSDRLRTSHQQNFTWLMAAASTSRRDASDLQAMFADRRTLATVPDEIAHFALFPYTNPELLYRYARLNAALNLIDVKPVIENVIAPALVVAGDADETTHLEGSIEVAQLLRRAICHVEPGGNHVAFFQAKPPTQMLFAEFMETIA